MEFSVKHDSKSKTNSSLCIFAYSHKTANIDDYIYYYLGHLSENNFDIVFVSNSKVSEPDLSKLRKICKRVIESRHFGLNFSAYKTGLLSEDYGRHYSSLLLTDDSLYGPLSPLEKIIKKMEFFDFWGLTENYDISYHLQSYFMFFTSKVTKSQLWQSFWDSVRDLETDDITVSPYEIDFSRLLIESSLFNYSSYIKYFDLLKYLRETNGYYFAEGNPGQNKYNATFYYWDILIENFKFPFIRKNLIDRRNYWREFGIITKPWKDVIAKESRYPITLIKDLQ